MVIYLLGLDVNSDSVVIGTFSRIFSSIITTGLFSVVYPMEYLTPTLPLINRINSIITVKTVGFPAVFCFSK